MSPITYSSYLLFVLNLLLLLAHNLQPELVGPTIIEIARTLNIKSKPSYKEPKICGLEK